MNVMMASSFMKYFILLLPFYCDLMECSSDGLYTSNTDLQMVLQTQTRLAEALRHYIEEETRKLSVLDKYVRSYEELTSSIEDAEQFVGNPVNSFLLIKRMTVDWTQLKALIDHKPADAILANITEVDTEKGDDKEYEEDKEKLVWPSEEDLKGAATGLLRLQDTYKLSASEMAMGKLNGINYGQQLSAHDCFELGRQAYNAGDDYHTSLWMQQALKMHDEEKVKSVSRTDILEYLAFSAYKRGQVGKALKLTEELLEIDPNHPRAKGNIGYYQRDLEEQRERPRRKGETGDDDLVDDEATVNEVRFGGIDVDTLGDERGLYEKLCRGDVTPTFSSRLKCRYSSGRHPYLAIGPVKLEEMHEHPRILMFHDVLMQTEVDTIKRLATPRFKRATVQNSATGELETANYRISKTAWLKSHEHEDIQKVYDRVAQVTGLNMETSEELQVSNYGIGGHYEPHYDFARRDERDAFASLGTGNRLATWLFYLSPVEQGGFTVFPKLKLGLRPEARSAVFWFNLHKNGEGDELTRHAACPVLAGSKWVSNFWIHERGQEFTHPCSLSPYE